MVSTIRACAVTLTAVVMVGNWYTAHYFNGEYYDTYEHVGGPRG